MTDDGVFKIKRRYGGVRDGKRIVRCVETGEELEPGACPVCDQAEKCVRKLQERNDSVAAAMLAGMVKGWKAYAAVAPSPETEEQDSAAAQAMAALLVAETFLDVGGPVEGEPQVGVDWGAPGGDASAVVQLVRCGGCGAFNVTDWRMFGPGDVEPTPEEYRRLLEDCVRGWVEGENVVGPIHRAADAIGLKLGPEYRRREDGDGEA